MQIIHIPRTQENNVQSAPLFVHKIRLQFSCDVHLHHWLTNLHCRFKEIQEYKSLCADSSQLGITLVVCTSGALLCVHIRLTRKLNVPAKPDGHSLFICTRREILCQIGSFPLLGWWPISGLIYLIQLRGSSSEIQLRIYFQLKTHCRSIN